MKNIKTILLFTALATIVVLLNAALVYFLISRSPPPPHLANVSAAEYRILLPGEWAYDVVVATNGDAWVSTAHNGLKRISEDGTITTYPIPSSSTVPVGDKLWILCDKDIGYLEGERFISVNASINFAGAPVADSKGRVWVLAANQVWRFTGNNAELLLEVAPPVHKRPRLTSLAIDGDEVWVGSGTFTGGSGSDGGSEWKSTTDVWSINGKTSGPVTAPLYHFDGKTWEALTAPSESINLTIARNGVLHAITWEGDIITKNGSSWSKPVAPFKFYNSALISASPKADLVICDMGRCYTLLNGVLTEILLVPERGTQLLDSGSLSEFSLYCDRNGRIWLATSEGIISFNPHELNSSRK